MQLALVTNFIQQGISKLEIGDIDDQSQQTLTNDQEKLNKELFNILHNDLNGSTIEDINSLLRKGADPNAQNQDGQLLYMWLSTVVVKK